MIRTLKLLAAAVVPESLDLSSLHEEIRNIIVKTRKFNYLCINKAGIYTTRDKSRHIMFYGTMFIECEYFYVSEMFHYINSDKLLKKIAMQASCYFGDEDMYFKISNFQVRSTDVTAALGSNNQIISEHILSIYGVENFLKCFSNNSLTGLCMRFATNSIKLIASKGLKIENYIDCRTYNFCHLDASYELKFELFSYLYSLDNFANYGLPDIFISPYIIPFLYESGYKFNIDFSVGMKLSGKDSCYVNRIHFDSLIIFMELGILSKREIIDACELQFLDYKGDSSCLFDIYMCERLHKIPSNRCLHWKNEDVEKLLLTALDNDPNIYQTACDNGLFRIAKALREIRYG